MDNDVQKDFIVTWKSKAAADGKAKQEAPPPPLLTPQCDSSKLPNRRIEAKAI